MGKRVAVVFTALAVVLLQWLASDAQSAPQFYTLPQPIASNQRMNAPQMMLPEWDYEVEYESEDVQRRVMERLFRKPPPTPGFDSRFQDVALQMAATEVRKIARTFGPKEGDFADKWVQRVMATEDAKARLDILDECFIDLWKPVPLDCKGLDNALRRFRMLLAPHTAVVQNAKYNVKALAAKFDAARQRAVELWMAKVEKGQQAEDPSLVLDECLISVTMGGPQSKDCFDFENALRNYKAAADLWAFQPA